MLNKVYQIGRAEVDQKYEDGFNFLNNEARFRRRAVIP